MGSPKAAFLPAMHAKQNTVCWILWHSMCNEVSMVYRSTMAAEIMGGSSEFMLIHNSICGVLLICCLYSSMMATSGVHCGMGLVVVKKCEVQ